MSLMKLFNFKFLMQNFKKSKNIILIFSILVPLLTTLIVIMLGSSTPTLVTEGTVEIINVLGMYVIPVIISMSLFGYVFKKNSVDFINSMPISRKSIFVTNTVGGIALIFVIQLLTLILTIIASMLFEELTFFVQMYIDIFFIMLISYIFVFVAANLAMTISGNYLTQIAVTMLILFLVPFCIDTLDGFITQKDIALSGTEYVIRAEKVEGLTFTKPYQNISNFIKYNDYKLFDFKSMCNMFMLSIIYIGIGIWLFEKRKMENTEESFANVYVHIFVKFLTLIPLVVFLNLIEPPITFLIFGIALIGVYYFVYDIITKRKVNFLLSVISFILSVAIIMGFSELIKNEDKKYELKASDITEIAININGNYYNYNKNSEIYLADRDVIDFIYNNLEKNVSYYYSYNTVPCYLKLNTDETLKVYLRLTTEPYNKLLNILENNNEYNNKLKKTLKIDKNSVMLLNNRKIDDDTVNIIKRELDNMLENLDVNDLKASNNGEYINVVLYKNNSIKNVYLPITLTEDIFTAVTRVSNNRAKKLIEEREKLDYKYLNYSIKELQYEDDYDYQKYSSALEYCCDEFNDFIKDNYNDVCNMNLKYYTIYGYGSNGTMVFFTNKTDEIDRMLEDAVKETEEDYEAKYKDVVYWEDEYVD